MHFTREYLRNPHLFPHGSFQLACSIHIAYLAPKLWENCEFGRPDQAYSARFSHLPEQSQHTTPTVCTGGGGAGRRHVVWTVAPIPCGHRFPRQPRCESCCFSTSCAGWNTASATGRRSRPALGAPQPLAVPAGCPHHHTPRMQFVQLCLIISLSSS